VRVECSTQNLSSTTPYNPPPTPTQGSLDPTGSPVVNSDTPTTENARSITTVTDVKQGMINTVCQFDKNLNLILYASIAINFKS
jgi:hypothetical protein